MARPVPGVLLEEGMVLAVEPMVTAGRHGVRVADDHWSIFSQDGSLAAHFEFTIAITADGPADPDPLARGLPQRAAAAAGLTVAGLIAVGRHPQPGSLASQDPATIPRCACSATVRALQVLLGEVAATVPVSRACPQEPLEIFPILRAKRA